MCVKCVRRVVGKKEKRVAAQKEVEATEAAPVDEKEKEKPKGKADEKEKTEKDSSKTSTDDKGL